MRIICTINGRIVPRNQAKVSVFDNSLFYADGLFETFLALGDKIIFLDDHLDRLYKGANLIGLNIPVSRETLVGWLNGANRKHRGKVKKIRLTITAGDSAFWAGRSTPSRIIIIVTDYALPTKPFRLSVSPYRVDQASPFRNVKTLSFIIEMTSRKRAYSSQFDDAILLTRTGYIAETTSANIFWVKNKRLYTPPLDAGCLEGMTRKHIIEICRQTGIPLIEKKSRLKSLLSADEIFVTSSIKLIIPVKSITTTKTISYKSGYITRTLRRRLLKYIETRE